MDTDRNLLFGVLALQAGFLDNTQFVEACAAWTTRKKVPLADLLVERGWLTAADKDEVERSLQRRLNRHGGDAKASLVTATIPHLRQVLAAVPDVEIQQSLADLPQNGQVVQSTLAFQLENRERYTLTRLHAKGGIGQVWLAHDADLGRDVALKELQAERNDNPAVSARFLEEAKITGQLEHPGIVPIYELARKSADQRPFYTMRFIRGRTLTDASKSYHHKRKAGEAGALDLRELLGAFVAVCNAVGYAHARGVLHRDLKGQNVVLGDFGEVMVLDWGLAKVLNSKQPDETGATSLLPVSVPGAEGRDATQHGQVLGTPAYMAPEQAEGRWDLLDARTDVYGLGAILYEILTGQPPFVQDDVLETLERVIREAPRRPGLVVQGTSPALEAVCLKALSKKPVERYATAPELAQEVQRWLADEPVTAWREPLHLRFRRWVKRRQALVAGAAAAILVAVLSLGVGVTLLSRSNDKLAVANQELEAANGREKTARLLAETNAQKAADSFHQAREAVDQFFTKVADSKELLGGTVGTQQLRRDLLTLAKNYYEGFLKDRQGDPAVREETAKTYLRMGQILAETKQGREALAALDQARALQEKLAREDPDRAEHSFLLASAHLQIGNSRFNAGNLDGAQTSFEDARQLLAKLVRDHPKVASYAAVLATTQNNLGALEDERRRPERSLVWLQQAEQIQKTLVKDNPTVVAYRADLARTHSNVGRALRNLGKFDQALASLTTARIMLAKLFQEHPDPRYGKELIDSCTALSIVHISRNQYDAALVVLEYEREIAERLTAENPAVADYASAQAAIYGHLGFVSWDPANPKKTMMWLEKCRALYTQLVQQYPGVPQYVADQAETYRVFGNAHRKTGNLTAALQAFRTAIQLLEELRRRHRDVISLTEQLARAHMDFAGVHLDLGKPAEALASTQAAHDLYAQLARDHATVPDYAIQRARTENDLGLILRRMGKFDDACRQYGLAIETLQIHFRQDPLNAQLKSYLSAAHAGRGDSLKELHKYEAALKDLDRALELVSGAWHAEIRAARAGVLALLGRVDEATKVARELTTNDAAPPGILYDAACIYALAARSVLQDSRLKSTERTQRAADQAAKAMQLLVRAQKAGYFKDPANVSHMKQDDDLEGLRARDDFQKLLADLGAKR